MPYKYAVCSIGRVGLDVGLFMNGSFTMLSTKTVGDALLSFAHVMC